MRGLKKGEYVVSSLSGKVSDASNGLGVGIYILEDEISEKVSDASNGLGVGKYILEDEIPAGSLEDNAMSQVSTVFNRNLGESALPPLHSHSNAEESLLPTRFAPSISNLGMVGATAGIIFLSRYLGKKLWQNKEPNKEEESGSKSEEIKDKSGDDLNPENTSIDKEKEMMRARDLEMKKLQILIRDKNKEIEEKIDNINKIFENKDGKVINHKNIEKKIDEVKKCFSTLNAFQQEFKDNFDHNYSMEKENIELEKKLVEIEDKKTLERAQEEASKYVAENPEIKLPNKKEVLEELERKDDFIVEEEIKGVIQPSASVELLKMQDLIILELFLLGRFQVNKITNQIEGHNNGKLNFYQMGFANDLTKKNLSNLDEDFNSPQSVESFNKYAKSFDPPIVRNPENLAKNYFHDLFKETVEAIYQKETNPNERENLKGDIADRVYFFLNYAMGDREAMLISYQEKELKGYSRAGLVGRGHASKASVDDLKKLCYCLKLFKNQLINVNNQELKDFLTNAFVKPNSIDSSFSVSVINSREEIIKNDANFVKDLIEELNRDENKIKGINGAKNIIINFFRQNAILNIEKISNDDLKEKFSEIITLSDGEVLKYLQKNSDLVDEIVILSKNQESKASFIELRKDLQKLYEKEKRIVVERESTKMQSSSR
jgi:hypothetical protein